VSHLSGHPSLTDLYLNNAPVTGKAIAHAATCPQLRLVFLEGTRVYGRELLPLASCPEFEILVLKGCGVTDDDLDEISQLGAIALFFHENEITDDGLMKLTQMKKLQAIYLGGSKTTDDALGG
jgi:hypothetical protein